VEEEIVGVRECGVWVSERGASKRFRQLPFIEKKGSRQKGKIVTSKTIAAAENRGGPFAHAGTEGVRYRVGQSTELKRQKVKTGGSERIRQKTSCELMLRKKTVGFQGGEKVKKRGGRED